MTGDWRKLHNEELNYLYRSPNIVRVIKSRMGGACSMYGEEEEEEEEGRRIQGFGGET
jgi:hypothetical protein